MSRWLASDEKSDLGSLVSKLKESYNDITTDGSNITMSNTDSGVTKTVSVSGSGSGGSVLAYNSSSFSNNTIEFGYTTGVGSDTLPLPSINALSTPQCQLTSLGTVTPTPTSRPQQPSPYLYHYPTPSSDKL